MFKIGETLTSKELVKKLKISDNTWRNNKKKYLEHLSHYYVIEETGKSNAKRYIIKEKIMDYEPYISPANKKKKQETYNEIILKEISKPGMSLQLYSTMTKRVRTYEEIKQYHHKEGTSYGYVNGGMKEMFGKDIGEWGTCGKYENRIWAKQLYGAKYDFEKLTEEEEEKWKEIITYYFSSNYIIDLLGLYEHGEIAKEDIKERMFLDSWDKYCLAKDAFFELFNFYPVRVKEYGQESKRF